MNLIETERLLLRNVCLDDAPFIVELVNDPAFIRFIGDKGVRTVEEAKTFLEQGILKSYRENGFGLYLTLQKSDHQPIGLSGLVRRPGLEHVDVGFAFLPAYCAMGYGTESARAVMAYAREELEIEQIVGITDQKNVASIGVLEKLGLRFERLICLPGSDEEIRLYS